MPAKESAPVKNRTASKPQAASAASPQAGLSPAGLSTADIAQAALADPQSVSPRDVLRLQGAVGNRAVSRLVAGPAIQAKLTVGAADDPYEREADQVAAQVTSSVARMPEEQPPAHRQAPRGFDNKLRRAGARALDLRGSFDAGQAVEERIAANSSGGSPLPAAVRSFMEPRFGKDFSSVRVHAGGESAQLNRQLGAQAFTHRNHVYLGQGASAGDRGLMAHELTHVVQQSGPGLRRLQRAVSKKQGKIVGKLKGMTADDSAVAQGAEQYRPGGKGEEKEARGLLHLPKEAKYGKDPTGARMSIRAALMAELGAGRPPRGAPGVQAPAAAVVPEQAGHHRQ